MGDVSQQGASEEVSKWLFDRALERILRSTILPTVGEPAILVLIRQFAITQISTADTLFNEWFIWGDDDKGGTRNILKPMLACQFCCHSTSMKLTGGHIDTEFVGECILCTKKVSNDWSKAVIVWRFHEKNKLTNVRGVQSRQFDKSGVMIHTKCADQFKLWTTGKIHVSSTRFLCSSQNPVCNTCREVSHLSVWCKTTKTRMCKFKSKTKCRYGSKCRFAHTFTELRSYCFKCGFHHLHHPTGCPSKISMGWSSKIDQRPALENSPYVYDPDYDGDDFYDHPFYYYHHNNRNQYIF